MRTKLQAASGIAVAATMLTALFATNGSGALAEEAKPLITAADEAPPAPLPANVHIITTSPLTSAAADEDVGVETTEGATSPAPAATLAQHVAAQTPGALDREMRCLAGAIYFEARGETLAGQLAVGRVIVERARSGRFPTSYCGVVYQRSQFSFVRGQSMPAISESSPAWKRAVAVARIADEGSWKSPTEGALFFHAARVSPGWRLKRLAQVDNHIFYR